MEIVVDTNFAITCTRQKLDFFNVAGQMIDEQVFWSIPDKVLEEIEKISNSRKDTLDDKKSARLFLDLLCVHTNGKAEIKKINLKIENVDDAIADYCKKNPEVVLATLDKKLKLRVKNRILTLKGKKFLRLI